MRRFMGGAVSLAVMVAAAMAQAAPPASQPASPPAVAPPWMAKDPSAWPAILLTNRVMTAPNAVGYSGSSALVRLPNNVVVLMTAGHLLGDAKPADFAKAFKSWVAVAGPGATAGVRMASVAMDTAQPSDLDVLVLLPGVQQTTWPATVLPVRQEPLHEGDVVYLVGIPAAGSKARQAVHKGVVAKVREDHNIEYTVEGTFPTTGNSGAPVLDALGRFAAINTAHLDDQNEPGKMKLVCISAADTLQRVKLPKGMKPLVLATQPAGDAAAASGSGDEADAEKLLMIGERGAAAGMPPDLARGALQAVIDKYPHTAAAKKAKADLDRK